MQRCRVTLAALGLAMTVTGAATGAQAFEFTGATLSLPYYQFIGEDRQRISLEGAAEFSFSDQFSVQVELLGAGYFVFGSTFEQISGGVHAIYNPTENLALGVFTYADYYTNSGARVTGFGVEANLRLGQRSGRKFDLQGVLFSAENADTFSASSVAHLGVDIGISTKIDLNLVAGMTSGSSNGQFGLIGATYHVTPATSIAAQYITYDIEGTPAESVGIVLTYNFGQGTKFRNRGTLNMLQGF